MNLKVVYQGCIVPARRQALALLYGAVAWLAFAGGQAHASVNCQAIKRVATLEASNIDKHAASALRATGTERVQFYTAPHVECPIADVFILPGEAVEAHAVHKGFTFVTYTNPGNGKKTTGWVQSERVAPR